MAVEAAAAVAVEAVVAAAVAVEAAVVRAAAAVVAVEAVVVMAVEGRLLAAPAVGVGEVKLEMVADRAIGILPHLVKIKENISLKLICCSGA